MNDEWKDYTFMYWGKSISNDNYVIITGIPACAECDDEVPHYHVHKDAYKHMREYDGGI